MSYINLSPVVLNSLESLELCRTTGYRGDGTRNGIVIDSQSETIQIGKKLANTFIIRDLTVEISSCVQFYGVYNIPYCRVYKNKYEHKLGSDGHRYDEVICTDKKK